MAGTFQPPPTYALPVIPDERTGKAIFNPIWLKWFLDLSANLGSNGAGSVSSVALAMPAAFSVAGSPITTSGGFTVTWTTAPTGTGAPVLATTPTLVTPVLGAATGTSLVLTGGITVVGGAKFLTTNTALTNGAGVAAGTLLTAPAAGNPTKWIGIDDNGTTRYIPAW